MLKKYYDNTRPDSLAARMRKKRLRLFQSLIETVPRPVKILDVGGTQQLWDYMELSGDTDINILLLNIRKGKITAPNIRQTIGDARDMPEFQDNEFDVVFSNSVIEHVGDFEDQRRMANEVRRVGRRYFVQTPNHYFPVEPHFVFPFFQFLPFQMKVWIATNLKPGWYQPTNREEAVELVNEIRLLRKRELMELFPDASFYEEKLMGLTKSFIVYGGWD
jgi:ubiquinone/menaquinone biosynthesis C-methylase UbiE